METARMRLGKRGEEIACEFLMNIGHTILERNWRHGHLETDIITLAKDGIHFVEVKSRVAPVSAAPEENVGYTKQKKLISAARKYLHSDAKKNKINADFDVYFDIISIVFEGGKVEVEYFPQAYIPIF